MPDAPVGPTRWYDRKTIVRGLLVSTVAWDFEIGPGRSAETMVFRCADAENPADFCAADFEYPLAVISHAWEASAEALDCAHAGVVGMVLRGELQAPQLPPG